MVAQMQPQINYNQEELQVELKINELNESVNYLNLPTTELFILTVCRLKFDCVSSLIN